MIKTLKMLALTLAVPAVLLSGSTAFAAAEGQVEGGNIFYAKNATKNTSFSDPVSADKCETIQYRIRIHNPGPGEIQGVTAKVNLTSSGSGTATVSSVNADPVSTSDTVTANIAGNYTVAYVPGSAQLLGPSAEVLSALPDTITTSGVTVGRVGVSLGEKRFVQFQAKVDCPTTPTPETPQTPKTSTPVSTVTPKALPSTGPEALLGGLTGVSALGYGVSRFVQSRRER